MNASTLRLAAVATALIEGAPVDAAECAWAKSYSRRVKAASEPRPDMRAAKAAASRLCAEYAITLDHLTSPNAKAECARRHLLAYQTSAWINQRALADPPQGRHLRFWKMLRTFDGVPSVKTIWRRLKELDRPPEAAGSVQPTDPCW